MKEMLKSKTIILFIILFLGITIIGGMLTKEEQKNAVVTSNDTNSLNH